MKNLIQLNYWTIGGFDGAKPIAQALAEAKQLGLDGLELTFGAGCFAPGISTTECKAICKEAKKLKIKIETVATGSFWNQSLADPRPEVRRKAIDFAEEYLRTAAAVGAKVALFVAGSVAVPWDPAQPVVSYKTVWKTATDSLKKLQPTAKKLGVRIALENVWNCFLTDPMAMKTFVDQFRGSTIGVYFDVGNCVINGYPEHWIEILGRRIFAVHVKNFTRTDCGGTLHGFGDDLMQGDVNWAAVLTALKKIDYRGPITAEMIPFCRLPDLVLPDMELARKTAEQLRQLVRKKQPQN